MLCRAVQGEELKISIFNISCLGVIYCMYTHVLQYTTARLQFLFSLHHLGRIIKGCSNDYDSESFTFIFTFINTYTTVQ